MTSDIKKQIRQVKEILSDESGTVSLILVSRIKKVPLQLDVVKLPLAENAAKELRKLTISKSSWFTKDEADIAFVGYSATDKSEQHQLMHVKLDAVHNANDLLNNINGISRGTRKVSDPFSKKLWCYIIVFENAKGDKCYIFTKYSQKKVLNKKGVFSLILKGGVYDIFKKELYLLDSRIDFILMGDTFLLINKTAFENIFRYQEYFKSNSEKVLSSMSQKFDIADFDKLNEKCLKSLPAMRRLSNIHDQKLVNSITVEKLKDIIKDQKLQIVIEESPDKKPVLKWGNNFRQLIYLFNEDYYKGAFTDKKYLSTSKRSR